MLFQQINQQTEAFKHSWLPLLRYVDECDDVKEDFIGYTNITGDTTGENIVDVLVEKLEALDLNLSAIRAQTYDGTGEKC